MKRWLFRILKVIVIVIVICGLLTAFFNFRFKRAATIAWGVSFSTGSAQWLGFNPVELYQRMLTELKPGHVRLMVYWQDIEHQQGAFDFSMFDPMIAASEKQGTKILLVVGHKQPRWPECHHPDWYNNLNATQQQQAVQTMVSTVVEHFKASPAIEAWQVENEPFFDYGPNCPTLTRDTLREEVDLVKSLDSRSVVTTDSGEKGAWFPAASVGDIFGATMYRTVYQDKSQKYITYPLPPLFYRVRAGMLQTLFPHKQVIGVELQGEPWFKSTAYDTDLAEQKRLMNPEIFAKNVQYARDVGFSQNYLWGVEWWYWLQSKGDGSMVDAARNLFLVTSN